MQVIDQQTREEYTNNEHLKLLSIFYFVFGGLSLLGAFILLIYGIVIGVIFSHEGVRESIESSGTDMETPLTLITIIFIFATLLVLAIGILRIVVGFKLRNRTHRTLTMVMGILALPSFPLGTALGIFTIIVLTRSSVIEMYRKSKEAIDDEKFGIKSF